MPRIIQKGATSNNIVAKNEIEIMENITYLTFETNMGFNEIMSLPYSVFLSYLKFTQLKQIRSTEEGRKALRDAETINEKEPDLEGFRRHT